MGKLLGSGTFGIAHEAEDREGNKFAIKIITTPINQLSQDNKNNIRREISICKELDHPNFVKIYDSFDYES